MAAARDQKRPEERSVAEQRAAQFSWRAWPSMIDAVARHRRPSGAEQQAPPRQRALDLGCGTGDVSRLLSERYNFAVTGVDGDEDMLGVARAEHGDAVEGGFICADLLTGLSNEGIQPASFDLVWSSFVVQYFPGRYEELMKVWASLLQPGSGLLAVAETDGLFACHEPQREGGAEAFEAFETWWRSARNYDTRCGQSIAHAARAAGLEVLEESEWRDAEFAFDGAAPQEIVDAWAARLSRAGVARSLKEYFGEEEARRRSDAFLECLASPRRPLA